ncbi:MAG: alpha/beta hydrolase [Culicoidibacterales bacterium]
MKKMSWQGRIMKASSELVSKQQKNRVQSVSKQRDQEKQLAKLQPIPKGITLKQFTLFGHLIEHLQAVPNSDKIIMYIHGGAYFKGSSWSHRALTTRLAQLTNASVYVINYSLAPETPFPGALVDTVIFYEWLAGKYPDLPIHIVGDSAGGGLSYATVAVLRDKHLHMPHSLTTLSPWTDLSFTLKRTQATDPVITLAELQAGAKAYADGHSVQSAKISPVFENLRGFPPTLIQVGEDELLLIDSIAMHEKLKTAQVPVEFEIFPKMWHVFQLAAPFVPESEAAIKKIVNFIEKHNEK